jgi:hypothetical protein
VYSNTNYILLGLLIEAAREEPDSSVSTSVRRDAVVLSLVSDA